MEYNISICNQNDKVKSYFLRFGSNFMFLFWMPQSGKSSSVIDIYFNNERCVLKEDRVGLSLNGIIDINILVSGINVFKKVMKVDSNGMSFCFIPFNEKEYELAYVLGSRIGKFVIDDSNYKKTEISNNVSLSGNNNDIVVYLEGNEIRDDKYNLVGYVNQDGFSVNWNNNSIERYGVFVGFIGDKSLKVEDRNSQGKSNTRTLMPGYMASAKGMGGIISHEPSGLIRRRDAAFVSLPVIMFVLSFMMLIGSIILLFILD